MNVNQIFNLLVEKKELQVKTNGLRPHENLRIRLTKLFSRHKKTMDELGDDSDGVLSMCARFESDSGYSTFKIARRKQGMALDFEIVGLGEGA